MHIYLLWTVILISHGVSYEFFENAKGIKIFYDDSTPMSFADYKIYSPDGKLFAEGETDKMGRILFMPDRVGKWRIEVDDGMGHGIIKEFEVKNIKEVIPVSQDKISIYFKILVGLSIILGLTGIFFYISAKKQRENAHT